MQKNYGKIAVLGPSLVFCDQIASYLGVIHGTPLGKDLLKEVESKIIGKDKFVIRSVPARDMTHMAFKNADFSGVYTLESYVLNGEWQLAVKEVRQAVQKCRVQNPNKLVQVLQSLRRGIPPITYSSQLNQQHADLVGQSEDDVFRAMGSKEGRSINTGLPLNVNGPDKPFADLLQKAEPSLAFQKYATLPKRGWYILLRELLDYLNPGSGYKNGLPSIAVAEENKNVSYKSYDKTKGHSPAIILAHEMIHALHSLNGIGFRNDAMEEAQTVGLHPYTNKKFTENKFCELLKGKGFGGHITQGARLHY